MANKKISELGTASTPLSGTELLEGVQGGTNVKMTTQDVADLAAGGGAVTSVNGQTGAVVLTAANVDALPDTYTPPDADASTKGIAKLFTAAGSGTDGAMNQSVATQLSKIIPMACSDETTPLATGTGKIKIRLPWAGTLIALRASLSTAQTSGSILTIDVNKNGTTVLSTKLTIDNTELTSTTAATPPVISVSSFADDDQLSVDIDQIGDATAKGLKITAYFS